MSGICKQNPRTSLSSFRMHRRRTDNLNPPQGLCWMGLGLDGKKTACEAPASSIYKLQSFILWIWFIRHYHTVPYACCIGLVAGSVVTGMAAALVLYACCLLQSKDENNEGPCALVGYSRAAAAVAGSVPAKNSDSSHWIDRIGPSDVLTRSVPVFQGH